MSNLRNKVSQKTAEKATANPNVVSFECSGAEVQTVLSVIEVNMMADARNKAYWGNRIASSILSSALYFTVDGLMKDFKPDYIEDMATAVAGWVKDVELEEFTADLNYQFDGLDSTYKPNLELLQMDMVSKYPARFGAPAGINIRKVKEFIETKMTEEHKNQLKIVSEGRFKAKNDKYNKAMDTTLSYIMPNTVIESLEAGDDIDTELDLVALRAIAENHSNATGDWFDHVDGIQRYHIIKGIARQMDADQNSKDALAFKKSVAGDDASEEFFLASKASALMVLRKCEEFIARAETIEKSNNTDEITRDKENNAFSDNLALPDSHKTREFNAGYEDLS